MPYDHLGEALATDYFMVREEFDDAEWDRFIATRRFVDEEVLPVINGYWERAEFPFALLPRLAELGIVGEDIEGHGCPGMSPLACGLVHMELHRGDGSLGTFLGVQAGLAMKTIALLGSEAQQERWLPSMARLETIGAFALTEPTHGSDSVALEASARRSGDTWILNGTKRWIGNGTIADVTVVWARDEGDGEVKGFLVDTKTDGYDASVIEGKGAARAIWQADITLTDVVVPESERLPGARTFADTANVLTATRGTIAWGALGHAVAAYDTALAYTKQREQFGRPLCSFQIIQDRLVKMLADVTGMQLYCMQLARLQSAGRLTDTVSGLAKLNNTRRARVVIAEARDILGGNGILLENHVIRHMGDIEMLHTYEGTETMQTLIVGRDITGVGAFT
ncbi:Acyl-CoA dehydrogenase [Paraconexibacter sp. AEG42_29]|uniref:Acyl-CoA dehydrogenase n=2 Tax=Paraconexibacter sp. AEG42_29 TaxID=2997339 RepID=A0AAU7B384_9ACTN